MIDLYYVLNCRDNITKMWRNAQPWINPISRQKVYSQDLCGYRVVSSPILIRNEPWTWRIKSNVNLFYKLPTTMSHHLHEDGAYCPKYVNNKTGLIIIQASSRRLTMAAKQRWAHRSVCIRRSFGFIDSPSFCFYIKSSIWLIAKQKNQLLLTWPALSVAQTLSKSENTGPGHSIVTQIPSDDSSERSVSKYPY